MPIISTDKVAAQSTIVAATSGSGVVIGSRYVLTAAHVVPTSVKQQMVIHRNGDVIPMTPVKIDRQQDLALLYGNVECPCASITETLIGIDDDVISVGYPLYLSYGTQIVSKGAIQGYHKSLVITTTSTTSGGSGGGLFIPNTTKLIGLTVAVGTSKTDELLSPTMSHSWISFSVPSSVISYFLKGTNIKKGP